ncbi:OmpA family protein [Flavobacterium sp. PS2]|uniref:OmpA family protein n=1 Tax=Flavobacterium sp. PS2 TaxID=3384157 RepID=UPI00390CC7DB
MAKGVKKIKWTGEGTVKSSLSIPNKKVTIDPDQFVLFTVGQWDEGVTEIEKKKNLTWMLQDRRAKTIIKQKTLPFNNKYGVKISRNLCGPFEYYVEASISGKRDVSRDCGLLISGYCQPKIIRSKWCTRNDGDDVSKTHLFSYGNTIYLNIETEGLNGHKNLIVDVFRKLPGFSTLVYTYTSVDVIDGEINLAMSNTFTWYGKMKLMRETEQFFVQVKDPTTGKYIGDSKHNIEHAKFLKILKKIESSDVKTPTNLTPLKVGKPDKNATRYEPCKFETIALDKVIVFDKGVSSKGANYPQETITKTIIFDFDSSIINGEGNSKLNNALQFLLEHEYSSITVAGYACVIGKENYNQGLSQRRSDAVKKLFVDGGLNPKRIISKGYGEIQIQAGNITVQANDDKKGKDNIKHKDEFTYKEARRVDVSFTFNGHAQTITYEMVAPSKDKNVTIDITEFQNKACFREKNKHEKKIRVTSPEYSEKKGKEKKGDTMTFPVHSSIEILNLSPMEYIWPRYNLVNGPKGKSTDSATVYNVHAHSCRYFTDEKYISVQVKAYPDIKWTFEFFLNLTNDLSVKWMGMDPYEHKKLQERSGKIGAEKRWKQKDVSIGFSLKAKWDNNEQEKELKYEYEAKFKKLYDIFSSIGALADGVTNKTKGAARSVSPKGVPMSFAVKPPNMSFTGDWFLANPKDNKTILGTDVTIGLQAKPLIGLEVTIDLLGAVVFGVGSLVGAGPGVTELYKKIQGALKSGIKAGNEKNGLSANIDIYMDLIITGEIKIGTDFKFNTVGKPKDSKFELRSENKLSVELKVGVKIKGEAAVVIIKVVAYFEASASASASVTFGHGINYNEKGLYYRPKLGFDGMNAEYVVKISASLAMKIAKDKEAVEETRGGDYTIAKGNYENVIPPFDVISELEELFGISANIGVIKN